LRRFAADHGLAVVADACQALGSTIDGAQVGIEATIGCFSGVVALCEAGTGKIFDLGGSDRQDQLGEGSHQPQRRGFSTPSS
jgi:hypothetical protein